MIDWFKLRNTIIGLPALLFAYEKRLKMSKIQNELVY